MPPIPRQYKRIRKAAELTRASMEDDFERIRPDLIEIAKNCYPVALRGLEQRVDRESSNPRTESMIGDSRLLDPTPLSALQRGAAGFHGNLTSPARKWFRLGLLDITSELEESDTASDIRQHLDRVTKVITFLFHFCGVYKQLHLLYTHLLSFGFAAMLVHEDTTRVARVITLRMGTYALDIDADGMVNRIVRRFQMTGSQLIAEFGDECLDVDTVKRIRDGAKVDFIVVNLIEPNYVNGLDADSVTPLCKLPHEMVYRSVYYTADYSDGPCNGVVRISGFPVKPIIAPRMNRETGDIYGVGSGHGALAVMRSLQAFSHDSLKASSNSSEPPVLASSDFAEEGVNLARGGLNYSEDRPEGKSYITPIFKGSDYSIDICKYNKEDAKENIGKLFFNDILASINALKEGKMTATEVDQRVREGMLMLGPVITSLDQELLDPLVSTIRYYAEHVNIKIDGVNDGAQPLIVTPQELAKAIHATRIEYVSSIHLAQRATELNVIERFVEFAGRIAAGSGETIDNVDLDAVIRDYARILGAQEKYLRKIIDIKTIRNKRAQEALARQRAEEQARTLEALAKAGGVSTDKTIAGDVSQQQQLGGNT